MSGSAMGGGPVTKKDSDALQDLETGRSYHELAVDAVVQYNLEQYDDTGVDMVMKEAPYIYTQTNSPGESEHLIENEKGEFDVALVDFDSRVVRYLEVKSSEGGVERAHNQLQRCAESFSNARERVPCFDWDMIGTVVVATNLDEDYTDPESFDSGYYCSADSAWTATGSDELYQLSEHIFDGRLSLDGDSFMDPFDAETVDKVLEGST